MENTDKIYLDTNLILQWFRLKIIRRSKKADEEVIIKFLSDHKEIKTFISVFSVAEIVANLRNEFKDKIHMDDIKALIEALKGMINIEIIKVDEFNVDGENKSGLLISADILQYAFLCFSARDAIHIDIAKANDLWLITRDDHIPRAKEVYKKIMGENKFRKQFYL